MAWLPPTIESVEFINMRFLNKRLEIRRLPESMQRLSAVYCNLNGTLDLQSFPVNMSFINLKRNDFIGTLDLTQLPESMQTIFVIQNSLDTIVFSNRLLPKEFLQANFYQVKKIRMVPIDGKKADSRISLLSSDIPRYVNRMGL
uniref:Uncharacterized protein n=1 Tax=Paramoeba aestuarina TaxID=180227 RepID=A0A7S4JHV5_9EUKA|mmetsp:Transcript_10337/g.15546  ORF Transcript_10337/g.15546 Transcript_10337/m.15546 type:complete len:144 (+) Transcript_10337:1-432(+)